jgi:acyl-CoA hydrolase
MQAKKCSESKIVMSEMVFPNDTNFYGNLMGGRLMYWIDTAAFMAAAKHSNAPCVTASADNISFESPIKLDRLCTSKHRFAGLSKPPWRSMSRSGAKTLRSNINTKAMKLT